jgi:hypothetical protein
LGFNGDLYPTAGATSVLTTKGDMVDFDTVRQRLAIGSANQVLTVTAGLPAWATAGGGVANGFITYGGNTITSNTSVQYMPLNSQDVNSINSGTEADYATSTDVAITLESSTVRLSANSLNADSTVGMRDDGAFAQGVTLTASTTGEFTNTADVTIAVDSLINLAFDNSASSSGSYVVRQLLVITK